jgi:hypothetical protein
MESLESHKSISVADHLLNTTYAVVKEPKLLISVIENLVLALEECVNTLLDYEGIYLGTSEDDFDAKIEMFRQKVISKYDIDKEFIDFLKGLRQIISDHKESSVEFTKKDIFVISDNEFNIQTLNKDDVRIMLEKTKAYVDILNAKILSDTK